MDVGVTTIGPIDEGRHRLQQGLAKRGQTIFDAWRVGGENMAGDEPVALQMAECLGKHALGNVRDGSMKFAEALRSRRELHDHERAPFVADSVEHVANGAVCGLGVAQLTLISAESLDRILDGTHSGSL